MNGYAVAKPGLLDWPADNSFEFSHDTGMLVSEVGGRMPGAGILGQVEDVGCLTREVAAQMQARFRAT